MKSLLACFIFLGCAFAQPKVVGKGCTTAFFLDLDCDGYGVGKLASGLYSIGYNGNLQGRLLNATTGDMPDADDQDPTVRTTAEWQAKWGTSNAAMVSFLQTRKGFANTSRIFYLSPAGDDATGVVNDPAKPYATMAPILIALHDLQGGAVVIRGGAWERLYADLVVDKVDNRKATSALKPFTQADVGQYLAITGGVGFTSGFTNYITSVDEFGTATFNWEVGTPGSAAGQGNMPLLHLSPCEKQACYNLNASAVKHLYVMAYPGERVTSRLGISIDTNYWPFIGSSSVTIDGLIIKAMFFGIADGFYTTGTDHWTVINCEIIGWHQTTWGNHTRDLLVKNNVFHDMMYHTVYNNFYDYDLTMTAAGEGSDVNFDFAKGEACWPICVGPSARTKVVDNVMYNNGAGGYEPIHINTHVDSPLIEGNIVSYSGGAAVAFQTGVANGIIRNNVFFDNGACAITLWTYAASASAKQHDILIENNTVYQGNPNDTIRSSTPACAITAAVDSGLPYHIENVIVRNNILVNYNLGSGFFVPAISLGRGSSAKTWTFQNNLIFSNALTNTTGTGTLRVASDSNADGSGAGDFTFVQFAAYGNNSGNLYGNPKFVDASLSYALTPGAYDFHLGVDSPALLAGSVLGYPYTPPVVVAPTPDPVPVPAPTPTPTPAPAPSAPRKGKPSKPLKAVAAKGRLR